MGVPPGQVDSAAIERKSIVIKARCRYCRGGERNHDVLAEHVESQEGEEWNHSRYLIAKCRGCDFVRFVIESRGFDLPGLLVSQYPDSISDFAIADSDIIEIPLVGMIYGETIEAYRRHCFILASGGIRACIEAACKHEGVKGRNLDEKINGLKSKEKLTDGQAQMLHAFRGLGNDALHDIIRPDQADVALALEVVTSILKTVYVYPAKVHEMSSRARMNEVKSDA